MGTQLKKADGTKLFPVVKSTDIMWSTDTYSVDFYKDGLGSRYIEFTLGAISWDVGGDIIGYSGNASLEWEFLGNHLMWITYSLSGDCGGLPDGDFGCSIQVEILPGKLNNYKSYKIIHASGKHPAMEGTTLSWGDSSVIFVSSPFWEASFTYEGTMLVALL